MVGVVGLEPTTSSSRTMRASQLRHTPMVPKRGVEPPRPIGHMALNHARLPIPPLRLTIIIAVIYYIDKYMISQSYGNPFNICQNIV